MRLYYLLFARSIYLRYNTGYLVTEGIHGCKCIIVKSSTGFSMTHLPKQIWGNNETLQQFYIGCVFSNILNSMNINDGKVNVFIVSGLDLPGSREETMYIIDMFREAIDHKDINYYIIQRPVNQSVDVMVDPQGNIHIREYLQSILTETQNENEHFITQQTRSVLGDPILNDSPSTKPIIKDAVKRFFVPAYPVPDRKECLSKFEIIDDIDHITNSFLETKLHLEYTCISSVNKSNNIEPSELSAGVARYRCRLCNKWFSMKEQSEHEKSCVATCQICSSSFTTIVGLETHHKEKHPNDKKLSH